MKLREIATASRFAPFCVAALTAIALGGCAQPRNTQAELSLEALAGAPVGAGWSTLQPAAALLRLSDGRDQLIALRERRQAQTLLQDIELPARGGAGRSYLSIALHGEAAQAGVYPGKPSEAAIRTEIAVAFPGRALKIVPQPHRNAYGPYGLAVSAGTDGQRCVYAWQWLERDDRRVAYSLGGAVSWRARICRKTQSLDEIAAMLDQIAIGTLPVGVAAPELHRAAPQKAKSRHVIPTAPTPTLRQTRAIEPANALPLAAAGGQRYLAVVAPAPRIPLSAGAAPSALDQSLPAEAYQGPGVRKAPVRRIPLHETVALRVVVPGPN